MGNMCNCIHLEKQILLEDSRFIFLNKPAGLAVHGVILDDLGVESLGVIEQLRKSRPSAPYLELAHRLDKATSGVLVIAKRKSALRSFQKQQESRGVDKHYAALVKGLWQGRHKKVDAPLLKKVDVAGKWTVMLDKIKGKRAVSYFSPVQLLDDSSLLNIKIITGRTHQIRVHAASIGFPIVGDDKYGNVAFNQKKKANRLMLHAQSIKFSLPDGIGYDVQAKCDFIV
ncbi:MAG: RluA family pseudouridine synthase [Ghiorsea sp.]|nr:RluA family pseudouridine synthase [Ghiorsea sp.]